MISYEGTRTRFLIARLNMNAVHDAQSAMSVIQSQSASMQIAVFMESHILSRATVAIWNSRASQSIEDVD